MNEELALEIIEELLTATREEQEDYSKLWNSNARLLELGVDSQDKLDKVILDWHNSDNPLPLYIYLGVSEEIWEEYLKKGDWTILAFG